MEQPHVRGDMAEHPGVCDDSDRVGLDGTNGVSQAQGFLAAEAAAAWQVHVSTVDSASDPLRD